MTKLTLPILSTVLVLVIGCSDDTNGPDKDLGAPDQIITHNEQGVDDKGPPDLPIGSEGTVPDGPRPEGPVIGPDGPVPDGPLPPDQMVPDQTLTPDASLLPACHPAVTKNCTNNLCTIPAGCFIMGSPASEQCRNPQGFGQETQHQVTFSKGFVIGQYEVTQAEWNALMPTNPSGFTSCGNNCPVEGVSWHQAVEYLNALSASQSLAQCYTCTGPAGAKECDTASAYTKITDCPGWRLPTEAEWEYTYRAGTVTAFYTGPFVGNCSADANADAAGWNDNIATTTKPVGGKQPNAWGLYDQSGNVWEWVHDRYSLNPGTAAVTDPVGPAGAIGADRLLRGGCYDTDAGTNRAAGPRRGRDPTTEDPYYIGFRITRTLP